MSDKQKKEINEKETVKIKVNSKDGMEIQTEKRKKKECNKCKENKDKYLKLKKELELFKTKTQNLESQIINLKKENSKAEEAFLTQAQTFQLKAKEKVEEFKKEHKEKVEEEIVYIKKYANSKFFKEIVEPWLNLGIAVEFGAQSGSQDVQNYVVGFQMLLKQIDSIMENHGLSRITPSVSEEFNPTTMEAISTIKNAKLRDKVAEIKKNGFKHHDRIIKPAIVVIGK